MIRAKCHYKEDEDGLPDELGVAVIVKVPKVLKYVALFAIVFVGTTVSQLGK
jgi:hypothetical protein